MTEDPQGLLREIERERLRLLVAADTDTAAELHSDAYELITPIGSALTKAEYLGSIAAGRLRYLAFEPVSEIAVRIAGAAAVLRYRARIIVEESPAHAEFTCWHTDYYELQSGRWQAVWSQATKIGRD